ncbi:MAG: PEP-CTERM sorting domain-containing protein [Planctomycetota bacterium]
MHLPFHTRYLAGGLTAFALTLSLPAAGAIVPFNENFDNAVDANNDGTPDDFSISSGYTLNNTTGTYDYLRTATFGSTRVSSVELTNAVSQPSITISSDFTVDDDNGSIGLGAFGDTSAFAGSVYLLDVNVDGSTSDLRIIRLAGSSIDPSGPTVITPIAFGFDDSLPFSLSATLADNNVSGLDISLTVTQGSDSFTINAVDPTPLTGEYFGYRLRVNGSGSGLTISGTADNFSVVPEPGTMALAGLGAAGIGLRRRRA